MTSNSSTSKAAKYVRYVRRLPQRVRFWLINKVHQLGLPTNPNGIKIFKLQKRFRGKRAFIIGNGPSLLPSDLEKLKDEITFAANRVHVAFNQTRWRPTFYIAVDTLMVSEIQNVLPHQSQSTILLPSYFSECSGNNIVFFNLHDDAHASPWPRFSNNLLACCYQGYTTTYIALQTAAAMGFAEVYLLGVDHHYEIVASKKPTRYIGGCAVYVATTENNNYFMPGCLNPGEEFCEVRLAEATLAYEAAKRYADSSGMQIYNATRGGKLEVFPRVNFESLF